MFALVGPTGVGKTTTIAKLATHPEYFRTRKIGFLTLDTYRVGAIEQLQTYAEKISGAKLPIVNEPKADLLIKIGVGRKTDALATYQSIATDESVSASQRQAAQDAIKALGK